jgi:Domain of Unknown Function (DUF1080)
MRYDVKRFNMRRHSQLHSLTTIFVTVGALAGGVVAPSQQPVTPARPHFAGFSHPEPVTFDNHDGWTPLWDGKTLKGWSGDANWKVENGAIVIESTCEKPTGTIYLVWEGEAADFELKLEMKGEGDINGGVQYRSWIVPASEGPPGGGPRQTGPCPSGQPRGVPPSRESEAQWNMAGPQYDFDAGNHFTGQFYEQATGRGIVAWRGDAVQTSEGKKPTLVGSLGDIRELGGYYKINEFNQLHIIARGNQMTQILNGHVVAMLLDDDKSKFHASGKIGIEVESTGKLYVRNIWLKKL